MLLHIRDLPVAVLQDFLGAASPMPPLSLGMHQPPTIAKIAAPKAAPSSCEGVMSSVCKTSTKIRSQREFGLRLGGRKQIVIDSDRRLLRLVAVGD